MSGLRPSFPGLLRAETRKVVLQRTTWAILAAGLGLFAVVGLGLSIAKPFQDQLRQTPTIWFENMLQILYLMFTTGSGIFILVVGSRLISNEYATGAIRVILGRGVGRLQLLAAKLVTMALAQIALLAAYALLAGAYLVLLVHAQTGSLSAFSGLSAAARSELGEVLKASAVSMGVDVLLASAAGVIGRGSGFSLGIALGFFPADNFGTIVLALIGTATGQKFWSEVSQWLLGPNLNYLLHVLEPTLRIRAAFAVPLVSVDLNHVLGVIAAWSVLLLAASAVLTWRRDVLE